MKTIFEIPENRLVSLQYRANKLALRARKHGLFEPQFKVLETFPKTIAVRDPLARIRGHEDDTKKIGLILARVEAFGLNPQLGEWDIVGYRYSASKDNVPILESGRVPPAKHGTELCCDHCGLKRRRKETLIVERRTDQAMVEVGSTCLSDFMGTDYNEGFLKMLSDTGRLMAEIEKASRWSFDDPEFSLHEEIRTVLAVASSFVRSEGFRNSKMAENQGMPSTASLVAEEMRRLNGNSVDTSTIMVLHSDFITADNIIAFFEAKQTSEPGFIANVQDCLKRGLATPRDIGLLAAAAGSYFKEMDKLKALEAFDPVAKSSRRLGEKGDKLTLQVTVAKIKNVESDWGRFSIISFVDDNNNLLVWKTSSEHQFREDHRYEIAGRVKAHDLCIYPPFVDTQQTVLSNVKASNHFGLKNASKSEIDQSVSDELDRFLGI